MMPFRFLSLPPELQINVIEKLPAKTIQRLRRVNKEIKGIVDRRGNHIAEIICRRELHRLNTFVANHVYYRDRPPFRERLARWVKLRGVHRDEESQRTSLQLFAMHELDMLELAVRERGDRMSLNGLIIQLDLRDDRDHEQVFEANGYPNMEGIITRASTYLFEWAAQTLTSQMVNRRALPHRPPVPRVHYQECEGQDSWSERIPAARLLGSIQCEPGQWMPSNVVYDVSGELGAAQLPGSEIFAYYVKRDSAHLRLDMHLRQGLVMRPLVKADLMNNLRVY